MSECQKQDQQQEGSRADRVARYKEERKRQLAARYGRREQIACDSSVGNGAQKKTPRDGAATTSSSSEGPRPTRASRLRAQATGSVAQDNVSSQIQGTRLTSLDKTPVSPLNGSGTGESSLRSTPTATRTRLERDKSAKRKSFLNRSLNSEEVPSDLSDDTKSRRRRRRLPPLEPTAKDSSHVATNTAEASTFIPPSPTSPITATVVSNAKSAPRKSELSIHMENARRGVTPSFSEMGKYKPYAKRFTSSPKEVKTNGLSGSDHETVTSDKECNGYTRLLNKENAKRKSDEVKSFSVSDNDDRKTTKNITKRMEELTAITKKTLAKVEMLANKNKDSPKKDLHTRNATVTKRVEIEKPVTKYTDYKTTLEKNVPFSILKKKTDDQSVPEPLLPLPSVLTAGPVSILKRKVSQDEHNKTEGAPSSTHTPPVTFSPSVVEPSTTNRRQGILKKRRSLDESQVMRHRSCSPDVVNKTIGGSILKNQRRSSLEDLTRSDSPEAHIQGILKRKTSKHDEEDLSLNSPQSILKRRSGASSANSTTSTPHVSITTAVILAAAGGAEIVLEPENEIVKPILKKKSFSEEHPYSETSADAPKPILKKKSSTDTDDYDDKPKPILKLPRASLDKETLDASQESRLNSTFRYGSSSETESEVKPILKQNSKEEASRPRLSFCGEDSSFDDSVVKSRNNRRSNTICTDFINLNNINEPKKEEDRHLKKPRPLSVFELVMSFEKSASNSSSSTGAIPKRSSLKRNSERYRTQPVTSNELEASLNLVKEDTKSLSSSIRSFEEKKHSINSSSHSLFDFTTSLEHDSQLNNFLSSTSSFINEPSDTVKMSSDSAFQSLGDGLELEQDEEKPPEIVKNKTKLEHTKLELQMKAIAEEAKNMKLGKGNIGLQKYRNRNADRSSSSRFSTQPVTFEEVQEASRLNQNKTDSEDESEKAPDRRGILKSKMDLPIPHRREPSPTHPKSALKKRDSLNGSPTRRSILKTETVDEGISCNDSGSDSEVSGHSPTTDQKSVRDSDLRHLPSKVGKSSESTSEGESSGGREVRSIFKNDNKLKLKQQLENVLSKSHSQGIFGGRRAVGDDSSLSTRPQNKGATSLRRSQTQGATDMPKSIADLRAELKEHGEKEWRKRIPQNNNATDEIKLLKEKNRYNDELSEKSLLALKRDELDASSKQWRVRVEKTDVEKFTVAGRMEKDVPQINSIEKTDRTPRAKRFKSKNGIECLSTPSSPEKNGNFDLIRSRSVCNASSNLISSELETKKTVSVVKPDDDTFSVFFESVEQKTTPEKIDLSLDDFNAVERDSSLLVFKKNVRVQRRRIASTNPIKALANRTDISTEYTEVITGVAEREKKRLNIEKLAAAHNHNKAIEALAGLASNEDFKSIALKKSQGPTQLLPYKELMLLQIKGRRYVQTRLVNPVVESINEGDCYILITSSKLYIYTGQYANVIEQNRATDIANNIQKTSDLGCKVNKIINVNEPSRNIEFWKLLGADEVPKTVRAGHPEEDETFENNIIHTNMIYTIENDELVPLENYWGVVPKIEILKESDVYVFDFGSEMYVWSGKNAPLDKKRTTLRLAKEMWEHGYNYDECGTCPLNISSSLGDRSQEKLPLKAEKRPDWALFAKITQHRETILFKEKFLDWPDLSRIIRVKSDENIKPVNASYDIKPCNVEEMLKEKGKQPDLVIQDIHLGRGDKYFDEETRRWFEFDTIEIKAWWILETSHQKLDGKSIGHFYDGDSYIYSWRYRSTVKGRELNGNPSKHLQVGKDRTVFFCWQGNNSPITEKCTAAFLTVELDTENAPQVRIVQGAEPAAFLRLFGGNMIIHSGKRDEKKNIDKPRMFIIRGQVEEEMYLMEVPLSMSQLRSRTSLIILDTENEEQVTIWHGAKSSQRKRAAVRSTVNRMMKNKPKELQLHLFEEDLDLVEMEEGSESEDFFDLLGNKRDLYHSLLNSDENYDYTMRLYHMTGVTGDFTANEILCPHRSEHSSPYPFVQRELYSASQPALFLIDNHHELWLWQGWWPEKEDETELSDQTGSGAVRWQVERRAAMQTAINYWKQLHSEGETVSASLVWAGLEPLEFKNLFPTWCDREDVAELNKKEGKKVGEKRILETELALLSRTTYPLEDLLKRPLPEGVDPTHLEIYLSPEEFESLLSMTKEEFQKLPSWKQTALKKEKNLF